MVQNTKMYKGYTTKSPFATPVTQLPSFPSYRRPQLWFLELVLYIHIISNFEFLNSTYSSYHSEVGSRTDITLYYK